MQEMLKGKQGFDPWVGKSLEGGHVTHCSDPAGESHEQRGPSGVSIGSQKSQAPSKWLSTLSKRQENSCLPERIDFETGNSDG